MPEVPRSMLVAEHQRKAAAAMHKCFSMADCGVAAANVKACAELSSGAESGSAGQISAQDCVSGMPGAPQSMLVAEHHR